MTWFAHWRWLLWGLIPLLLFIPLIDPLLTRKHGIARYREVIASIHAAGSPTEMSELKALAPTVDVDAEDAWDSWLDRLRLLRDKRGMDWHSWFKVDFQKMAELKDGDQWWLGPSPRAPEALASEIDRYRALLDEARQILRQGSLNLSWFGTTAMKQPDGSMVMGMKHRTATWDFRPVILVAQWLCGDALLSPSPGDDLADLEQLRRAAFPFGSTTISGRDFNRINGLRDALYVRLELASRLDPGARARWLAESNRTFVCAADALRFYRINWYQAQAERTITSTPWEFIQDYGTGNLKNWVAGPGSLAEAIMAVEQLEDRLRGKASPEIAASLRRTTPSPSPGDWANYLRANLISYATTALHGDCQFTMVRLAMRTLLLARTSPGGLPADHDALMQALQDGGSPAPAGDHYRLRYRKLASDRFRIALDPQSQRPDFDLGTTPSQFDLPASTSAFELDDCTIEIQVPPAAR